MATVENIVNLHSAVARLSTLTDGDDVSGCKAKLLGLSMEATQTKPDGTARTAEEFKSEIRRLFQVFSQSAVRASQAVGASFSEQALGGLGS